MGAKLKGLTKDVFLILLGFGAIIGLFTYMVTSTDSFKQVVAHGGDATAAVAINVFDWIGAKAGGSAATTGPEVIYVQNSAPNRWHVGAAIRVWNKGLTNVQLQAVQTCPSDGTCFKVSQVSELPRDNGRLVLGRTSTFLTKSIRFNGAAVREVPAALLWVAACHEVGHALGAEHSASMKSCMHATVSAGVSTRPDKADYAAVNAKYGN